MLELLILKPGRKPPALAPVAGDYGEWVAAGMRWPAGAVRIVAVDEGHALPSPETVAAAVVTGSAAMVTDGSDWMERTAAWLRDAVGAGLPVLGICFGHQLLAQALGGRAGWNPEGVEVGVVEIALTAAAGEDPLFSGMPRRFPACVSHRQSTVEVPPGAVRLASSAMDANQAFRVGDRAWGVQFHPEFGAAIMPAYVAGFRAVLEAEGKDRAAILRGLRPTAQSARLLRRFAAIARESDRHTGAQRAMVSAATADTSQPPGTRH
jgi:GMP synthase (glutamine-hydrolysing)